MKDALKKVMGKMWPTRSPSTAQPGTQTATTTSKSSPAVRIGAGDEGRAGITRNEGVEDLIDIEEKEVELVIHAKCPAKLYIEAGDKQGSFSVAVGDTVTLTGGEAAKLATIYVTDLTTGEDRTTGPYAMHPVKHGWKVGRIVGCNNPRFKAIGGRMTKDEATAQLVKLSLEGEDVQWPD